MSFSPVRPNRRKTLRCEPLEDRLCLTVITFESLPAASQPPGTSFSADGFDIAVHGTRPTEVHAPGDCSPDCPENGGQYLRTQVDGVLTFTEKNNRAFALHSLQVAESFEKIPSFWATQIDIKGIHVSGKTVVTSVDLDGIQDGFGPADDFQTFALPDEFEEILLFQVSGSGGFLRDDFSIDNVKVSILGDPDPPVDDPDPPSGDPDLPVKAIATLIAKVEDLDLHHGTEKSLIKKLEGVQDKFLDGNSKNDHAAIGKMNSFVRHVRAQSGKKIDAHDAAELIADAEKIIGILEDGLERPGKSHGPGFHGPPWWLLDF